MPWDWFKNHINTLSADLWVYNTELYNITLRTYLLREQRKFVSTGSSEARGSAGWGTALQVGRSRVRIPMVSLDFFHWHPAALYMTLGLTKPLTEMSTRNISWGSKGGRSVRLTTVPASCANCLEIWESQPPGTLGTCPALQWDCFYWKLHLFVYVLVVSLFSILTCCVCKLCFGTCSVVATAADTRNRCMVWTRSDCWLTGLWQRVTTALC
jgi:hypothetical protein